jgi:uracil-DNA glycosylase
MTTDLRQELYDLLLDTSDLLRDGFRRSHAPLPEEPAADSGDAALPATSPAAALLLAEIAAEVSRCTRCGLSAKRKHTVPGEGAVPPQVLVVGEAPGADEDASGRPFVGAAGKYLDKWLEAIGLDRGMHCFIANILKCRPPGNRDPHPDEVAACMPYLERQIEALAPSVILAAGRIAAQHLLGTTAPLGALREKSLEYRGIPVVVTYHPSAVLRNPDYRKPVWEDLRRLKRLLDVAPSPSPSGE